ncbi:aspartate aminotransferase [Putridiphycobacter roseus]|uniref:Aminotransferase n=1 Tax=Putridiphycobacter roseus TaxID=2219161 RepID=A0A2W1N2H5_9FLAO|nr:pyridoxal phosphate-dependent aminotransferase [Putridiphycobacter roseus]PZE18044.1 aspartate aminotransferase [Putridiphycobacter roseus]
MTVLSNRVNELEESATIAMAQKSRTLKEQGIDIISLSLGEPDFMVPDFIKEAAKKAIDDNFSKYTPVPGYLDLREAVALKFKRDNGLTYAPNQIVVSTGAKQSLINVLLAMINPGDEVIVPAPYWVTYFEQVKMAGGIPVVVKATFENDFKVTADQIKAAITPKTKMMIFSNPCNPTGASYTKEELQAIAKVVAATPNFYVMSDEIYEHINFVRKHESFAQFPEVYDRTITVNGLSKAFAMTGYRLGYIGAPVEIAAAATKLQGQYTSATCSIAQRAAIAALEADPSQIQYMIDAFNARRLIVFDLLKTIPNIKVNLPEGAFYFFIDVSYYFGKTIQGHLIKDANDLSLFLLDKAHVAVVTGQAFGDDNCVRLSYASDEATLREAIDRIRVTLEN